ncbi:MAG TPA: S9 family peptidase, partial [Opitutaceae bacterium]
LLAHTLDYTGYRQYALQVKDLRTGRLLLKHPIERVTSVAWALDNDTLFFTQEDPVAKRSYLLGRVSLKTGKVETLYEEKDELYDIDLSRSLDGRYVFCTSTSKETSEVRALRADEPAGSFHVLIPREDDHEYYAEHRDGLFYFVTNRDAENFRVVTAPVDTPEVAHWKDFVPHNPAVRVESVELFAHHAVVSELEGGLPYLRVIELDTAAQHRIAFPEPAYEAALDINLEFDTSVVRFNYQSPVTPASIFDYDMATHSRVLVKQQEVLGGFDASHYTCERIFAPASDGTRVPVTLVYRRDLRKDGPQPLLLYGYGSYGYSLPDTFSSNRISLLDRGLIYAIAHIRGGGELGEPWHDRGKMKVKMNTFTDFIACAEHLVSTGYTTPAQLVTEGGSAGGLLIGAVINLRPDLWHAAILDVPFVDVINTMLDASLPLTTSEYLEWGNPNEPEEYRWIRAYSPYDNIGPQAYPHLLVNVSLHDSQVPYWEGAKFAARLRATKTDSNALLLKTNLDAGHGGASGRYDALKEVAFDYAFLLTALGLE